MKTDDFAKMKIYFTSGTHFCKIRWDDISTILV